MKFMQKDMIESLSYSMNGFIKTKNINSYVPSFHFIMIDGHGTLRVHKEVLNSKVEANKNLRFLAFKNALEITFKIEPSKYFEGKADDVIILKEVHYKLNDKTVEIIPIINIIPYLEALEVVLTLKL